jgi:hypothetical protein
MRRPTTTRSGRRGRHLRGTAAWTVRGHRKPAGLPVLREIPYRSPRRGSALDAWSAGMSAWGTVMNCWSLGRRTRRGTHGWHGWPGPACWPGAASCAAGGRYRDRRTSVREALADPLNAFKYWSRPAPASRTRRAERALRRLRGPPYPRRWPGPPSSGGEPLPGHHRLDWRNPARYALVLVRICRRSEWLC